MLVFNGDCGLTDLCSHLFSFLQGIMTSPTTWMGILGMMIILILMAYKWRSAMIIGIGFVTVVSWFRNTAVTYFPDTPAGDARYATSFIFFHDEIFVFLIPIQLTIVLVDSHTLLKLWPLKRWTSFSLRTTSPT